MIMRLSLSLLYEIHLIVDIYFSYNDVKIKYMYLGLISIYIL